MYLGTSNAHTIVGLVRRFDQDKAGASAKLQDWLETDPDGFRRGAITAVRAGRDSSGLQCIVRLLIRARMLEQVLADEDVSLQDAVKIGRLAIEIDPHLEVRLARRLAESVTGGARRGAAERAPRLMSVLEKISDGSGIIPSLVRVLRNSDPHVRSKAVLMLARGNRSANWVHSHLLDPDARIRANAIEALWGVESETARDLLLSVIDDPNNRVVGNALLGLYRLGDSRALAGVMKMAAHPSTAFRATAAWLMGETGDERFSAALARLERDPVIAVRSRALKANNRLRAALARASQAAPWHVAGHFMKAGSAPQQGNRRLLASVNPSDGKGLIQLLPTQFHLIEDGNPILSYGVTERAVPQTVSLFFVFPREGAHPDSPWVAAARRCLSFKPAADRWACLQWASPGASAGADPEDQSVRSADPRHLISALTVSAAVEECPNLWRAMWRAAREARQAEGTRRVIVVSDETVSGGAGYQLVQMLSDARDMMRVISRGRNAPVEALCRRAEISLTPAETPDAIASAIEHECLGLLSRYEISYQPLSWHARQLEIRVRSPEGAGALRLAVAS